MLLTLRTADAKDWAMVRRHLERAGLPVVGVKAHLEHFTLAWHEQHLVGIAGLEVYGDAALLRSVAVNSSLRGQGVGTELVRHSLETARGMNVKDVVLLTETAEDYFPRFSFRVIPRDAVPAAVKQSLEFRGACPDSATAMHLRLE
ncbi:MAG: GNAT family N-acetyltransferase [Pleurocapsa sp. SU_196_0]|nr:GNAT family N-acetyltransferase [Pleurocapsa sp. SU_196_0]